jgi:hypothetical protein
MKATLEFNLPEEAQEFRTAINGWKFKSVLNEINEDLRSKIKWQDDIPDEVRQALQAVRDDMYQRLSEHNINLEEE